MADLTKQQLIIESNNTYLNNNSGEIGADDVRAFNETLINNTVNQADYTADSSSFDERINQGGGGTVPAGTVSGSSQVTLEDTTFTDGIQFQVLRTDGAGNLSFDFADRTQIEVRASEAIAKGDPLYVVSFNVGQNRVEVAKADASDPSKMPVYGLAYESVSQNTNTQMVSIGTLDDIDTQVTYDFQVGDTVYVAAGGGLTNVKPTGTNLIQNVGIVGRRNQNNGEIVVSAIGRSNDVPNIQEGYVWAGNASGVATPISTGSFVGAVPVGVATTGSNTFDGDQVITGSLHIQDSSYTSLRISSGPTDPSPIIIDSNPDFVTKFDGGGIKGISTYGGYKVSGSWGAVGYGPGGAGSGGVVGIYNNSTSSTANVVIRHNTNSGGELGYTAYSSFPATSGQESRLRLKGTEIFLSASTGSKQTSVQVDGDVSASVFTGSFDGSWSGDLDIDGTINVINGGINTSTNTTVSFGRELFVTQSQPSSTGAIVFSYPYPASGGSTGQVVQKFSTYEGGTQFDQQISGVDFSYFKHDQGTMIFETIGSGQINFFPAGNFNSNKILKQSISELNPYTEANSIAIAPFTGSSGQIYSYSSFGVQRYPGSVKNAYVAEFADSSFQKYSGVFAGEDYCKFMVGTGGDDYDYDEIRLQDNNDGSSTINLKADTLNVGVQTATSINIGNDGGSNIISGSTAFSTNTTTNGWAIQTFDDVSNNNQINQFKVNNWTSPTGHTIANSTIGWQRYDGTVHGWVQELYTADYAYGSSVQHEPGKWGTQLFASGSAYSGGEIKIQDQGDTTVQITLDADKTNVTNVMKLSQLDPLPAGTVGELAVSGSNLYFYDGSWRQVSLV